MIYDRFQATGACDAAQVLSDLFGIRLYDDDVQYFDTRWDQALLAASEIPINAKVCTSQKYRIPFNFTLYWLCMNKKTFEIRDHQESERKESLR